MQLKAISLGSKGSLVKQWQYFLSGKGFYAGMADGDFGPKTLEATKEFQSHHKLVPDGYVGNATFGKAVTLGFLAVSDPRVDDASPHWPAKPAFPPLVTNAAKEALFGKFTYISAPAPGNPEQIRITNNWERVYIRTITIPQLSKVHSSGRLRFHRAAERQLTDLWCAWEQAGLLPLVKSWGGAYTPRFVRGSRKALSNHAFGTAFDINMKWNALGAVPALRGREGSVRELVGIAHQHGFYWGGHFTRLDGMHFEVARLL